MAKFSRAKWHAVRNYTKGGQEKVLGLVVHIMDGTLEGSQSWFNNPSAKASSHFGVGKDGDLRQWVDTADRAWAQADGNRTYLSIENEGRGGDALTAKQIEENAQVFAWVHKTYGVPLQRAKKVGDKGLAYHALGGASWGGHTSCPGTKVVAQLDAIVARAKQIAGIKDIPAVELLPFPGVKYFFIGRTSTTITRLGQALVRAGYKGYRVGPGPVFTSADKKAVKWFQQKQGWTGVDADGIPGPETWKRLKVRKK